MTPPAQLVFSALLFLAPLFAIVVWGVRSRQRGRRLMEDLQAFVGALATHNFDCSIESPSNMVGQRWVVRAHRLRDGILEELEVSSHRVNVAIRVTVNGIPEKTTVHQGSAHEFWDAPVSLTGDEVFDRRYHCDAEGSPARVDLPATIRHALLNTDLPRIGSVKSTGCEFWYSLDQPFSHSDAEQCMALAEDARRHTSRLVEAIGGK